MEFHRCGVVGVSSPDERTLGGKSSENLLFRSTGVSTEEDECLLFATAGDVALTSTGVFISPSSII